MGSPEFAIPSLTELINNGYDIVAVVTKSDKRQGRGKKLLSPPVKTFAQLHNIPVLQPLSLKTEQFFDEMQQLSPDFMVTVAFGKIIPVEILEIPRFGCINVHASLLPKYRGAAPIQWAVINGEKSTGITTMLTDEGLDTGKMLLKQDCEIAEDETYEHLQNKLSVLGASLLQKTLTMLIDGSIKGIDQNNEEATYAPMITKETGKINWTNSALQIKNLICGVDPWPGAFTFYMGEKMRIWKANIEDENFESEEVGTIINVGKNSIIVRCGKGSLCITEIQFDNSRRMNVSEYLCGHNIEKGVILK
jgi:methionyl-tRNA formyltransferase